MLDYTSTPENFKTLANCRSEVCKALLANPAVVMPSPSSLPPSCRSWLPAMK
nr:pyridoxal phosphate homeostasis protein [Ipomoea batatas]